MSKEDKKGFFTEPITRRISFGRILKLAGAAVVLPRIVSCTPSPPSEQRSPQPDSLLSEDELKKAHIRIIPTDDVMLRLKESIFNFPIFKDALKGKLKEVVIVLVDHPNLSWNTSNKMPEDAKQAFQAGTINPSERSIEKVIANELENNNDLGLISRLDRPFISQDIIEYTQTKWPEISKRVLRYNQLLYNHPEMANKVFIYIAVGGNQKPHPNQSYPSPGQFIEILRAHPPNAYSEGTNRYSDPYTPGRIIEHEVKHYQSGLTSSSEYDTDTKMFESITNAYKKKRSGDESGYPFQFITNEGITTTKSISQQGPVSQAV